MANHTLRSNYHKSFETGLTASTTRTQGNGVLTAAINEIAIVANDGDVVTLPPAMEGFETAIINNGAKELQIFPASGENLGNGLNQSVKLEANEEMKFFATGDAKYHIEDTTEVFHAEIHDEDNVTAFVINGKNEQHAYHSEGVHSGDLAGWIFNQGSNGTSFLIIGISNLNGGKIDVEIDSNHGLKIGDTVCHTGLANSNYVGFFIVLAITSDVSYSVSAPYSATGTGFMNIPSYIQVQDIAIGTYMITWTASLSVLGAAIILDFFLHDGAVIVEGSKGRHRIANAAAFKMVGGQAIRKVISGDRIFFAMSNTTNSTNVTIRNFSLIAVKL